MKNNHNYDDFEKKLIDYYSNKNVQQKLIEGEEEAINLAWETEKSNNN